ncbi:MAG: histidine kinase, partial [Saprospiraceae bacterium]
WVKAYFKDTYWSDELVILSQAEIEQLNNSKNILSFHPVMPIYATISEHGNTVYISLSLLISFLLFIPIFLVSVTDDFIRQKGWSTYPLTTLLAISIAIFLYAYLLSGMEWFSIIFNLLAVKNFISFLSLFYIITLLKSKTTHLSFLKREIYKFLVISMFGTISEYVGGHIVNSIYSNFFSENDVNIGVGYLDLRILGWVKFYLYFAASNFLVNLIKYLWSLRKKEKSLNTALALSRETSAALSMLHARVNPHFLYNSLNTIASLAHIDKKKTQQMALQLVKFYQNYNENGHTHLVSIQDELAMLDAYLQIEKIRFGDRLKVEISVSDDCQDVSIPKFILQPLVENAIKYGYDHDTDDIFVLVKIERSAGMLQIKVMDHGLAFPTDLQIGYGISSIKKKLKLLYNDRHSITFVNEPNKYIEINLPVTAL